MLSLKIHHNIHLSKDQRYNLHKGCDQKVIGYTIPVWNTDAFAKEFFCVYYLKNTRIETPIKILDEGFEIVLPFRESRIPSLSNKKWREMIRPCWDQNCSQEQFNSLENYYRNCRQEISSKNLLDHIDEGSKGMHYREHSKIKKNKKDVEIWHYINIKSIDDLLDSIL